jgi:hypothetical protein
MAANKAGNLIAFKSVSAGDERWKYHGFGEMFRLEGFWGQNLKMRGLAVPYITSVLVFLGGLSKIGSL